MYKIENDILIVEIAEKGAEIQRIFNKETLLEYIWNGDPAYWAKHSPVLFPIVGSLKGGKYTYEGKEYALSRHGFARDKIFEAENESPESIILKLQDTEDTFIAYPFHFELKITYTLEKNKVNVHYGITNTGSNDMFFSIGAHPAFRVPLTEGAKFEDYQLTFNEFENTARYPLNDEGLLKEKPEIFFQHSNELRLKKPLFYKDALVFKTLQSSSITIESDRTHHGITVDFKGFPYMGIWSAKDADFVCIEPWLGIADNENASGKLEEKEGIISLEPDKYFGAQWSMSFF
ncbi:MAG: aldose 1-epimerase family protein [Arachidicoccus sp.]|nr:aldose 1-epimerase family protein [Arachidicoccus sp.]